MALSMAWPTRPVGAEVFVSMQCVSATRGIMAHFASITNVCRSSPGLELKDTKRRPHARIWVYVIIKPANVPATLRIIFGMVRPANC